MSMMFAFLAASLAVTLVGGCATAEKVEGPAATDPGVSTVASSNITQHLSVADLTVIEGNAWTEPMARLGSSVEAWVAPHRGMVVARTERNELLIGVSVEAAFKATNSPLTSEFAAVLDRLAANLVEQTSLRIVVHGHTDNVGSLALNDSIAKERANIVRRYLLSRGLAPGVIRAVGRGTREPIADNKTAVGRARNRRVELLIRDPVGP